MPVGGVDPKDLLARAIAAHRSQSGELAAELYRQVLRLRPQDLTAISNLALLLPRDDPSGAAERWLRRAVRIAPADAAARYNLGNLLHAQEDWASAAVAYAAAIILDPRLAQAYVNLGSSQYQNGAAESADRNLARALRLAPTSVLALHKRSQVLQDLGHFEPALSLYRAALDLGLPEASPPGVALVQRLDDLAVGHRLRLGENRSDLSRRFPRRPAPGSASRPYITLVGCTRNDGHGGDGLGRTELWLVWALRQFERFAIEGEVILVDWNPPADRPSLREALRLPEARRYGRVRIIEVPSAIHHGLIEGTACAASPIMVALGLNVGYRRAQGEFVLLTTTDIIYPDAVFEQLSQRRLDPTRYYRVERADVPRQALETDIGDLQDWCRSNVMLRWRRRVMSGGWPSNLPMLFSNASGDFILMAREVLHRLRGLREDDPTHMHCDSLLLYGAHGLGIREAVLSGEVYHIDHDGGWEARLSRNPEILSTGVHFNDAHAYYTQMMIDLGLSRRAYDFNDPDWGLGDVDLAEWVL